MDYFGEPWASGICDEGRQQDTPVGKRCLFCEEPIVEGDQGSYTIANPAIRQCMDEDYLVFILTELPMFPDAGARSCGVNANHRECLFRETQGGIGHHEDHVRWCTVEHDPDGGRTKRQSSIEVWDLLTGR